MKQKIFWWIGILVLIIFGVEIFGGFMANHTYYNGMLKNRTNRKLIIRAIISAIIPVFYIIKNKSFSIKKLIMYILIWLLLFSLIHVNVKWPIIAGWWIMLLFNTILLFALGIYFILGLASIGNLITHRWIKFKENLLKEILIKFGIGLWIFLLLINVLSLLGIMYSAISWLIFIWFGVAIYFARKFLNQDWTQISEIFKKYHWKNIKTDRWKIVGIVLILFSIMYYFYGFQLSFIPYSTAWDANHAYMYFPKIWALNNGVFWSDWPSSQPFLWFSYITYWFSLVNPISKWFWLSPDNIAVSMNFLSGVFVLFFGLWLIQEVIKFFSKKFNEATTSLTKYTWRIFLLLWLTSWMWAFLVFVDNKTDLGVLAMTILAVLSGFVFINYISNHDTKSKKLNKETIKYIIVSGIFFGLATLAKPTAFVDIAIFGILLVSLWFNATIGIGWWISVLWLLWIIKILYSSEFINTNLGKYIFIIWLVITIVGVILLFTKKRTKAFWNKKTHYIKYMAIWIIALIWILLVFRLPYIAYKQISNGNVSISKLWKGLLMGYNNTPTMKLASTNNLEKLTVSTDSKKELTPSQCKQIKYDKEELNSWLKTAKGSGLSEDVGRYVWFGQKEFNKNQIKWVTKIGYGLLKLLYPWENICYGLNSWARTLCKNKEVIYRFDINGFKNIIQKLDQNTKPYELINNAILAYENKYWSEAKVVNPNEFSDEILAIKHYTEAHSVKVESNKVLVPYRYIVPLNIVFNWSLQNLSSYYTDIGFIWGLAFLFIIWALVYAIVQKDKNLLALTSSTIIGWAIRWAIWGGILWYGIGLVIWTILVLILFIKDLLDNSDDENTKYLWYVALSLLALWCIIQLVLNFVRISSQGSQWPFVWYKMHTGKTTEITSQLQHKPKIDYGYGYDDVFDLQFPHYNKIIQETENRADEDGILIAGTYLSYFLSNQTNLKYDGMLSWLWKQTSDNDSCMSYQRLKNNNIKYISIDPNIGTVVMGDGNKSLFDRFFANIDTVTGKVKEHGTITMLVKLVSEWYLELFSTNNIGSKYAFVLEDKDFKNAFGDISKDDLILLRWKLSVARFFPDSQELIEFIGNMFTKRMINGKAIGDIADAYGKIINEEMVLSVAQKYIEWANPMHLESEIGGLTNDERLILSQYIWMLNMMRSNSPEYPKYVNNMMQQSLGGSSQIITFELID